jgi:hypothetical protein
VFVEGFLLVTIAFVFGFWMGRDQTDLFRRSPCADCMATRAEIERTALLRRVGAARAQHLADLQLAADHFADGVPLLLQKQIEPRAAIAAFQDWASSRASAVPSDPSEPHPDEGKSS